MRSIRIFVSILFLLVQASCFTKNINYMPSEEIKANTTDGLYDFEELDDSLEYDSNEQISLNNLSRPKRQGRSVNQNAGGVFSSSKVRSSQLKEADNIQDSQYGSGSVGTGLHDFQMDQRLSRKEQIIVLKKLYENPEMQLKRWLFANNRIDATSRPRYNNSEVVKMLVGISLFHILEAHEKSQTVTLLLAIRVLWRDHFLTWNMSEFNGINRIIIPARSIWLPDLTIMNSATRQQHDYNSQYNAKVWYDGKVMWMFPMVSKIYCTLDVRYFPFDQQRCNITFSLWTYHGFEVDLRAQKAKNYFTEPNQEWNVYKIEKHTRREYYICCPEPYPEVAFTLYMKRRSTFYISNLIAPCFLVYLISFLGFFIPVESGEKINLVITILLAMIVFLMVVSETLPPTPDSIPLMGKFFGFTMVLLAVALLFVVTVTNVHYRKNCGHPPPRILMFIFVDAPSYIWYYLKQFLKFSQPIKRRCCNQKYYMPGTMIANPIIYDKPRSRSLATSLLGNRSSNLTEKSVPRKRHNAVRSQNMSFENNFYSPISNNMGMVSPFFKHKSPPIYSLLKPTSLEKDRKSSPDGAVKSKQKKKFISSDAKTRPDTLVLSSDLLNSVSFAGNYQMETTTEQNRPTSPAAIIFNRKQSKCSNSPLVSDNDSLTMSKSGMTDSCVSREIAALIASSEDLSNHTVEDTHETTSSYEKEVDSDPGRNFSTLSALNNGTIDQRSSGLINLSEQNQILGNRLDSFQKVDATNAPIFFCNSRQSLEENKTALSLEKILNPCRGAEKTIINGTRLQSPDPLHMMGEVDHSPYDLQRNTVHPGLVHSPVNNSRYKFYSKKKRAPSLNIHHDDHYFAKHSYRKMWMNLANNLDIFFLLIYLTSSIIVMWWIFDSVPGDYLHDHDTHK